MLSEEEWEAFKAEAFPPLLLDYFEHLDAWDSKQAQRALGFSYLEVNIAYDIGLIAPIRPPEEDYRRLPLLRYAWKIRGKYLPRPLVLRVYQPRDPLTPEELQVMGEEFLSDICASGQMNLSYREFRAFRRAAGLKYTGKTRTGMRGYRLRDIDQIRCDRDGLGTSRYALTPE